MIQAVSLVKRYGDLVALDHLDLMVGAGQICCLLGANGAGKTTTINLFLGFIQPTSGEARIMGHAVAQDPLKARRVLTYIPETLTLYPHLSGLENLAYFAGLAGKRHPQAALSGYLSQAGLEESAHARRAGTYSKGMRQKVGIALALAKEASVLLLDEPTSGLDPQAASEFAALLLDLRARGTAILMTTHDLFRAHQTGTHIGIMKQGKLISQVAAGDISLPELETLYLQVIGSAATSYPAAS
jgi:ABC-2 type transport system ATP-binding protein